MPEPGRRTSWTSVGSVGEPRWPAVDTHPSMHYNQFNSGYDSPVPIDPTEEIFSRNLPFKYRNNNFNGEFSLTRKLTFNQIIQSAWFFISSARATINVVLLTLTVYLAIIGSWFVITQVHQPNARAVNISSPLFSALEAKSLLGKFTTVPRPYGSDANRRTRTFLLDTIKEYKTLAISYGRDSEFISVVDDHVNLMCGDTYFESDSVVVKIAGKDSQGSLLISAHYDSVPTIRALIFSSTDLKHDVLFNFNNAEENGLWGANAFSKHTLWGSVKAFVNIEGTGDADNTRSLLFRTNSFSMTSEWSKYVAYPHASVFANDVMSLIGSRTDYQIYTLNGGNKPGLDLAFIANRYLYHTPGDNNNHQSEISLQTLGDNLLAFITGICSSDALLNVNASVPISKNQTPAADFPFYDILGLFLILETSKKYKLEIIVMIGIFFSLALLRFLYEAVYGRLGTSLELSTSLKHGSSLRRAFKLYAKPFLQAALLVFFLFGFAIFSVLILSFIKHEINPAATYGLPGLQIMWIIPCVGLSFIMGLVLVWDLVASAVKLRPNAPPEYSTLPTMPLDSQASPEIPQGYVENRENIRHSIASFGGSAVTEDSSEIQDGVEVIDPAPVMQNIEPIVPEAPFPWEDTNSDEDSDLSDNDELHYTEEDNIFTVRTRQFVHNNDEENYRGIDNRNSFSTLPSVGISKPTLPHSSSDNLITYDDFQDDQNMDATGSRNPARRRTNMSRRSQRQNSNWMPTNSFTSSSGFTIVTPGAKLDSWLPFGILAFWLCLSLASYRLATLSTPVHATYFFSVFAFCSTVACAITWVITSTMHRWWRSDLLLESTRMTPLQVSFLYFYERRWWAIHLLISTTLPTILMLDAFSLMLKAIPSLIAENLPEVALDTFFGVIVTIMGVNLLPAIHRACVKNPTDQSRTKLRKLRKATKRRSTMYFNGTNSWVNSFMYTTTHFATLTYERFLELWWSRPVAVVLVGVFFVWFAITYLISLIAFPMSSDRPFKSSFAHIWDISVPQKAVGNFGSASKVIISEMGPWTVDAFAKEMDHVLNLASNGTCEHPQNNGKRYCYWENAENPIIKGVDSKSVKDVRELIKINVISGSTLINRNTQLPMTGNKRVLAAATGTFNGTPGSRICQIQAKFEFAEHVSPVIPEVWILDNESPDRWVNCDGDKPKIPKLENPFDLQDTFTNKLFSLNMQSNFQDKSSLSFGYDDTPLITSTAISHSNVFARGFVTRDRRMTRSWIVRLIAEEDIEVHDVDVTISCWHGLETSPVYKILKEKLPGWMTFTSSSRGGVVEVKKTVNISLKS
ncbi:hypothetical protein HK096_007502 [Nowakowskiella sp. JEL0078]|nr:hypothetical protein HK096_007502 [Nowakowskiella sp. JEL0078]